MTEMENSTNQYLCFRTNIIKSVFREEVLLVPKRFLAVVVAAVLAAALEPDLFSPLPLTNLNNDDSLAIK